MKKIISIAITLCAVYALQAQTSVCFTYDAAGNRTKRELCCTACLTNSGVEDRQPVSVTSGAEKLTIVPNPSAGVVSFRTEGIPADAQVTLFDLSGAILAQRLLGDGRFDWSAQPPGTYVVHIRYGDTRKTVLFEKVNR